MTLELDIGWIEYRVYLVPCVSPVIPKRDAKGRTRVGRDT